MGWKPEYADNRRRKYHSDPAERDHRKSQGRSPEENREYMREYYLANPDKFVRSDEQREERNRKRRERYASDLEYRERVKRQAKSGDPRKKRDTRLRKQYGIGVDEYEQMLTDQGGGCAICGVKFGDPTGRKLAVDHCHKTGKVRGLLCGSCNQGLGKFGDDPDRLDRAGLYVRSHRRPPSTG